MENDKVIVSTRKLIQLGGSIALTLPQEWLEKQGLKPGDTVGIVANGVLKIVPANEGK